MCLGGTALLRYWLLRSPFIVKTLFSLHSILTMQLLTQLTISSYFPLSFRYVSFLTFLWFPTPLSTISFPSSSIHIFNVRTFLFQPVLPRWCHPFSCFNYYLQFWCPNLHLTWTFIFFCNSAFDIFCQKNSLSSTWLKPSQALRPKMSPTFPNS